MTRRALLLASSLGAAAARLTAAGPSPKASRAAIAALERTLDRRIAALWPEDAFLLLGGTRGIYLEGYGAVFTAEINLITGPTVNPFHQAITKEEVARHRRRKLERLPRLRVEMRAMLAAAAASLDTVPADERIVLGFNLTRYPWEDSTGVPSQILAEARKARLLEARGAEAAQLEAAVRMEDF